VIKNIKKKKKIPVHTLWHQRTQQPVSSQTH